MNTPPPAVDLPRITLGVLALGTMIAASLWIMLPFVLSVAWAATIVIATWPILTGLQARFGGRRGAAVTVMVVALLALVVTPIWLGAAAVASNVDRIGEFMRSLAIQGLPPPPDWLHRIPLLGERLVEKWQGYAGNPEAVVTRLQPYARRTIQWILSKAGDVGGVIVQLLLMVAVAGILYASGETAARGVLRFLRRLAGGFSSSPVSSGG
jgi:predicted PurR-regulated permease PerM